MAESREASNCKLLLHANSSINEKTRESPSEQGNITSSEDEQDVHYCGKCKLSFFAISEYVQHKINKVCRENKNTLRKVVEKLPIGVNYKTSGTWEDPCSKDTDGFLPDDKKTTMINVVMTPDVSSASRRVEVQFLEPLVGSELTKDLNIADEASSSKAAKRHKRKSSQPKTTRKRKSSSSSSLPVVEKVKEPRDQKTTTKLTNESVTVHIPETQLVHLNSTSVSSSCPSPPGTAVRKQGATSVFVPIYLNQSTKVYKCQRCHAVFQTLEEKEEHSKMHKKEFRCSLCSKTFVTANGFEQHQLNESHSHPCDQCGKVFTSVVQLKKHTITHSTDRPFGCDQCEKSFFSLTNLRSHVRTVHATERRHKCPECGKAFARKDKMKRHSLIHYPDTRPTFTCPFRSHTGCMKTFYREDKLKRHLFTHSKDKPFKCEQCNKGYARRDNLNDHMRIHTGNYSHTCGICNKGFIGPHKLAKHMKSAHKQGEPKIEAAVSQEPQHLPTMVSLDACLLSRVQPRVESNVTQPLTDAENEMSLADGPIEDDGEAFDIPESESDAEGTLEEEEQQVFHGISLPTATSQPTSSQEHGSRGRLQGIRPVPRVNAAPQTFIPPPLPPGLHATAELMAFSQEIFNVVGKFQS